MSRQKSVTVGAVMGAVLVMVLWPSTAEAQYLDPGASSIVLQLIVAAVVGVAAAVKLYWGKITGILERRHKSDSKA